jgi:predicted ribonuclease YlaK
MAIMAGLEQVLGMDQGKYQKIVISRPVEPMGKDIGFLPGTMEDKILPWLNQYKITSSSSWDQIEQCLICIWKKERLKLRP